MSKKILEFDTRDWYSEDEEQYLLNYESEMEYLKEILDKMFDGYFVLSGTAGLWNGQFEYAPIILTFDEFLKKMCACDDFNFVLYDDRLEVFGIHHDGVNQYILTPLEKLKKKELLELAKGDYGLNNEVAKDWAGVPMSRLRKDDIIDYLTSNR